LALTQAPSILNGANAVVRTIKGNKTNANDVKNTAISSSTSTVTTVATSGASIGVLIVVVCFVIAMLFLVKYI